MLVLRGERLDAALPDPGRRGAGRFLRVLSVEGRLPERPLEPLLGQLVARGMTLSRGGHAALLRREAVPGRRSPCRATCPRSTCPGLLLALPLLDGRQHADRSPAQLESAAYIAHDGAGALQVAACASKRRREYLPRARRPALSPARADVGSRATGQTPHSSCAWARCPAAGITVSGPEPCLRPGRPRGAGSFCAPWARRSRSEERLCDGQRGAACVGVTKSTPRPYPI